MHPDFHQMGIDERQRELEEQVRNGFVRRQVAEQRPAEPEVVVLRLCSVHDDEALERIAALEGLPVAAGRHVVAEVNGAIVASVPLAGGRDRRSVPRNGALAAAARAAREAAHAGAPHRAHSGAPERSPRLEPRLEESVEAGQGERGQGHDGLSRRLRRCHVARIRP